jgi:hypothetical protein
MHEFLRYSTNVTVWCGVISSIVIGPYILRTKNTNRSSKCRKLSGHAWELLASEVRRLCLRNPWFQQEGLHPIQPDFPRICCGTFFQDDSFRRYFLTSTVSGPDGPWLLSARCTNVSCLSGHVHQHLMTRILEEITIITQEDPRDPISRVGKLVKDVAWQPLFSRYKTFVCLYRVSRILYFDIIMPSPLLLVFKWY